MTHQELPFLKTFVITEDVRAGGTAKIRPGTFPMSPQIVPVGPYRNVGRVPEEFKVHHYPAATSEVRVVVA
jgi:hypothetical protein